MKIVIAIDADHRTFQGDDVDAAGEFGEILHHLADAEHRWPPKTRNILDRHGNTVGFMAVATKRGCPTPNRR